MAASETSDKNPIGIYLVYDKNKKGVSRIHNIPGHVYSNVLYRQENKDTMIIAALPKIFYDNITDKDLEEHNIAIRRFRPPDNDKLKDGTTYGFYIKSDSETYTKFANSLNNLFATFETSDLIEKESYEIIYPKAYPNGSMRNYAIVSFKKNDKGVFPKSYIRKLKILLNNSTHQHVTFKVDWLSVNVMRDIKKGHSKEKKEKSEVSIDVSN